ncbi:hypothetical protein L484_025023 [Morus notabilis]|uniref:Alkaline/neutral invertase n=1 Tax=Morus notabilis TaxID=981085 RepID=W9QVI9_9ROSA|nr:hypothetical protein L484_025023 [Morus notabilis]
MTRETDFSKFTSWPKRPLNMERFSQHSFESLSMLVKAREAFKRAVVFLQGQPVGTVAALDDSEEKGIFSKCDLFSEESGFRNRETFYLDYYAYSILEEKDKFPMAEGVMLASFKVVHDPIRNSEILTADFGESAIGRVAPVDSGLWWIILLGAYTKSTETLPWLNLLSARKEKRVLANLGDCPEIIVCFGHKVTVERGMQLYNLVLEYAPFGTLSDLIQTFILRDINIRIYTKMMLKGLRYMHAKFRVD